MGREIRRVPPNWEHPKKEYDRIEHGRYVRVLDYKQMFDRPFAPAMEEWYAEWKAHKPEEHEGMQYWEWSGGPPDPEYYRPDWDKGTATWFQVYQTVGEGSPVSPPFATQAELVDYLVEHGDFWDQSRGDGGWERKNAESFVGSGWAPSLIGLAGQMHAPRDGNPFASAGA